MKFSNCVLILALILVSASLRSEVTADDVAKRPNIVFVLCDDHRFDCLGIAGHPFLETPHLDQLARDGAICNRAYVTTSLCSPSRASILTGQYAHNHRVIDNYHPVDPDLVFFPQHLQAAGYETAFIGKWHKGGEIDDPQRGFDHWIAFKGQGTYFPDGRGTTREVPQTTYDGLNINGKRVPQKGYITDELTDYAIEWLADRSDEKPFFLYVSHKAVHSDFVPADRHRGRYDDQPLPIEVPSVSEMNAGKLPMWVRNQRNSRHGVDFGYNLKGFTPEVYYRRYCETLLAVDESVGRLRQELADRNWMDNTVFIYMGDNGFQFGDHGLIDKRVAYEASARVPLIMTAPGRIPSGQSFDGLIANIDIGPTLLEAASAKPLDEVDGMSVWKPLCEADAGSLEGRSVLYEYLWERNYPQTPTMHALLGTRYKYVRYHGLWDRDELFDLQNDPGEMHNLIDDEDQAVRVEEMNARLWEMIQSSDGNEIPILEDRGSTYPLRNPQKAPQASFPDEFFK
ncbi:sulfatase [Rubripirellula amarantea]|nr:sulfatase [Rubripirellula amarantea]